jgi:hypothetical protein
MELGETGRASRQSDGRRAGWGLERLGRTSLGVSTGSPPPAGGALTVNSYLCAGSPLRRTTRMRRSRWVRSRWLCVFDRERERVPFSNGPCLLWTSKGGSVAARGCQDGDGECAWGIEFCRRETEVFCPMNASDVKLLERLEGAALGKK